MHGYRIWPVEVIDQRFGDGWDKFRSVHQLKPGFKVIFACERKWIFHTVILDENDQEVRFHLSGPNMHCQQLHPPLGRCAAMLVVCSLLSGKSLLKVGLFSNLRLCYGSICCFVLAGLRTSCLPSSISHEQTVLQFGHLHLPMVKNYNTVIIFSHNSLW